MLAFLLFLMHALEKECSYGNYINVYHEY